MTAAQLTVLLVDDDADLLLWLRLKLELEGWAVTTAMTGEEALEAVADGEPALIVMDLHMPGMGGRACIEQLRARQVGSAIVVFSSFIGWEGAQLPDELEVVPIRKTDERGLDWVINHLRRTMISPAPRVEATGQRSAV